MRPLGKIPRLFDCTTNRFVLGSRSRLPQISHSRSYATTNDKFDTETDLLIVGSGAAGLVAAVRAHHHGLKPLIVEKSTKIGGTSAYSGGGLWIPNNHVSRAAGIPDSQEDALKYMEAVIKEGAPESSRERKMAFLENGPKMVKWLEELGFKWKASVGYSDYHPDSPGARTRGRGIEGQVFNMKKLGDWEDRVLTKPTMASVALYSNEASSVMRPLASMKDLWNVFKIMVVRTLGRRLIGQHPATLGKSLVSQLLLMNKGRGTEIWCSSPLVELIRGGDGAVIGAAVNKEGKIIRVRAISGVLLAAGGFAKNQQMREKYGPKPANVEWTSVPPGDSGDAINAGMKIGAATALMDDAWWGPTMMQNGIPGFDVGARSAPHGIIVDSSGSRFMNESQSYVDAGHQQYARHKKVDAIPAYLVIDSNHRRRYILGNLPPRSTPKSAFTSGFLFQGETIEELADKLGIDAANLSATIKRFNEFARTGIDEDFGRGGNAYDNVYSDPKVRPNPNLGSIKRAPFYATKMYPGDLGTKGGLVTDEYARVIGEDGRVLRGLYGAGNTTASVMGRRYPGPGSTLGPATTFAFIAVNHVATAKRT